MQLTAIGEETSVRTGKTTFYLVFDDGKLRVPVTQEALVEVIKTMPAMRINEEALHQVANGVPASALAAAVAADEVTDEDYDPLSDQM
jgi:hypothetical protein